MEASCQHQLPNCPINCQLTNNTSALTKEYDFLWRSLFEENIETGVVMPLTFLSVICHVQIYCLVLSISAKYLWIVSDKKYWEECEWNVSSDLVNEMSGRIKEDSLLSLLL